MLASTSDDSPSEPPACEKALESYSRLSRNPLGSQKVENILEVDGKPVKYVFDCRQLVIGINQVKKMWCSLVKYDVETQM